MNEGADGVFLIFFLARAVLSFFRYEAKTEKGGMTSTEGGGGGGGEGCRVEK